MREPLRRLPDGDHGDEDEADDEHRGDHLLALLGRGRALLGGRGGGVDAQQGHGERGHAATLADHAGVGLQGQFDGLDACSLLRCAEECGRVAAVAERRPRLAEPALAK